MYKRQVEELAFALSAGNDYIARLTDAGLTVDEAARKLRFSFSVTSNYFMEIAKFRAARMLWANIVKAYNPEKHCAGKMMIHATTSKWNQTVYDPYVNMLRGTTEAMSAAVSYTHLDVYKRQIPHGPSGNRPERRRDTGPSASPAPAAKMR